MRELSLQEVTTVSAAEKAIFELTPSDTLPYAAGVFGGFWLSNTLKEAAQASTYEFVKGSIGTLTASSVGLVAGAVGCFLLGKYATEKWLQPYL